MTGSHASSGGTRQGVTRNDPRHDQAAQVLALILACLFLLGACGPTAAVSPPLATAIPGAPAATPQLVIPTEMPTLAPTALPTEVPTEAPAGAATRVPIEVPVEVIPLAGLDAGPVAGPNAEYSGLAWYGDWLILMPQYPGRFAGGSDGAVLALPRADLLAHLDGAATALLEPRVVPFTAPGLAAAVPGFEGYEALAFHGEDVFFTIEASAAGGMRGYLVSGRVMPDLSELVLDPETLVEIPMSAQSGNKSYESLLLADGELLAIYEANGAAVGSNALAQRFDLALTPAGSVSFPQVEYRITDVTTLDAEARFWAINYFFPGEPELAPEMDPLAEGFGRGPTHAQAEHVERLLQFQYTASGIRLVDRPPLQLALLPDEARNWEGIVRLDGRGFVLVTDKFPETILAFVPGP